MSRTYSWDDTYCPKGHGDWVFIPASTLYSDIYWCARCDSFYYPRIDALSYEELNKEFFTDRAEALIRRGEFIKWEESLSYTDMEQATLQKPDKEDL